MFSGEYAEGAQHGDAVYYFNEGTVWRRDTWNEGGPVSKWLNPATTKLSREQLEAIGAVGGGNDVGGTIDCGEKDPREECRPRAPSPTFVLYHETGRLRASGSISDGLRTDEWTFWYPSSAVAKRVGFAGGSLMGTYREWYENGRPSVEGEYLSGEKTGLWRYWDRAGKLRREQHGK